MQLTIYLVLQIFIAISIAIISLFKSKTIRGRKSVLALSLTSLFCHISYLQFALSPTNLTEVIKTAVLLLGLTLAATFLLTFSLEYTNRSHLINRGGIVLLSVIPIVTQIIYWIPEVAYSFQTQSSRDIEAVTLLLETFNSLYRYLFLATAVWITGRTIFLRFGLFKVRFWTMLLGPSLFLVAQGLLLLRANEILVTELSLFSINVAALGLALNVFQIGSDARLLVRRGNVVEKMDDGWIVLDSQNLIIDLNQAIYKILDMPREKLFGRSITSVLKDFPNLIELMDENHEIEVDRTIEVDGEYRYLNIRVSALKNDASIPNGRLVMWRDITNHRRAEDARQQARDEMFVLLNAISSAASQSTSLSEFLSDAIYQIIYPFRSQVVFIYLVDERSGRDNSREHFLAAHLGLSTDTSKEWGKLSPSLPLFEWLEEKKEPLLLDDPENERIPEHMKELNMSCLLVLPLLAQSEEGKKLIGSLFLGRKENPTYKQDEIVRLTILADQIATLIDNDRRRKLAIALSERQRLMRDIHDSLSQKLYGLVTLTEAAQAAIEADSQLDYAQVLSKIGENARQAVKELRLFLFQMQPIDLEKESLISVLHHRLAAVEGRADIKARFLADEPISLPKRKEIALYFIAQEALNNVLRHAHAKSVSVILKQGYKYVTLEIADDGCGFDSTNLERGGLGLKNITERVKQENGKLKISSKVGEGTIIKVTFERDFSSDSGEK